ncbi:hypothetical protein [Paenisporosarcina sp. NPDC076898]|uniref:hypothetical protein n=1 Tax=unclassified Paenisporosarcina TaxID=2642018 RepID=UPI003D04AA67
MKKGIVIMLCFFAVTLFFIWNKTELINPLGIVNSFKTEWGINLPMPDERIEVWGSETSFHGDGEWFNVLQYSNQKISIENSGMIVLTTDNVDEATNKIEHFIKTTISMRYDNELEQAKEAFVQYSIEPQLGDFYFYKEENGGYDYFIALFKQHDNKLYTFEWHQ